jgi:hypothetical protein
MFELAAHFWSQLGAAPLPAAQLAVGRCEILYSFDDQV